jgi:hypothetical protein
VGRQGQENFCFKGKIPFPANAPFCYSLCKQAHTMAEATKLKLFLPKSQISFVSKKISKQEKGRWNRWVKIFGFSSNCFLYNKNLLAKILRKYKKALLYILTFIIYLKLFISISYLFFYLFSNI